MYSEGALHRTEIDHWLSFTIGPLTCGDEFEKAIAYLDSVVAPKEFLVNKTLSAADYAVYGALRANSQWQQLLTSKAGPKNAIAWFNFIGARSEVKQSVSKLPKDLVLAKPKTSVKKAANNQKPAEKAGTKGSRKDQPKQTKDEGKFVDLPGAETGKVIVRFPPEASG